MKDFATLYRENEQVIKAIVYRRCPDRDLAEDIVQDAWLLILRNLPRLKNEAWFTTWAIRVAINCTYTALRNANRRQRREVDLEDDSAITEFDSDLLFSTVAKALPRLPDRQRAVFELHDLKGYDHVQIGRRLNMTRGASRHALSLARANLRGLLQVAA